MLIKKIVQYGFFAALVLGVVFLWDRIVLPCEQLITYALGTFDTRFGLSEEDFLKEVALAEQLWEGALGKELFQYVPGAVFRVNLIFDERQERTFEAQKLEETLQNTKDVQDTLEQKQNRVLTFYKQTSGEYERMLLSYKKRLDSYNAEVKRWNKAGGAPPAEYENLVKAAKTLEKDGRELEEKRQEVNRLVIQVNAFSKQKVAVVEGYNEQVEGYVSRYGESGEFDQGDYVGQEINIYQYDDLVHLRAVLVHEFGHALGLTHGTDPTSIMFHLMKDQDLDPLALSDEDKMMLKTQCSQTVWDIMLQRISLLQERVVSDGKP